MDDLDAIDLSFIGMGSYINEKDPIPEDKDEIDEDVIIEDIKENYITAKPKKKQILRPFEQHVQNTIKKIYYKGKK